MPDDCPVCDNLSSVFYEKDSYGTWWGVACPTCGISIECCHKTEREAIFFWNKLKLRKKPCPDDCPGTLGDDE